ncbi:MULTISPECIES: tyrosine-protein phosphatase [unclassified Streptomyces]|uniref:tyrosine-protein phosphatase n=1 Tax=unclassified Streptomyces TaxID=2593676 RepID=UPI001660E8BD|nr:MULTISPECIES: tyrosine-protein phosphatase [unclassified Streptomyces]MBD0708890.1 tyrosine protein phosphatase [Streptomyces sp. CBMA291]MBD0715989.1 tyrosine protein phosphatase [Streptomyces sp. CBMA370]
MKIDGVRNLRDAGGVGGLPKGLLFRSGALDGLTAEGARGLTGLGIRTVVDLRSLPEVAARPDVLHGSGIGHLHVPVFAEQRWPDEQMELYPAMAEHAGRAALTVLRRLTAEEPAPVLVHCASGKDRTGVVVAVLQSLLGASEAEVTADFVRSNTELGLTTDSASPSPRAHNTRPVEPRHLHRALLWIRSHHGSLPTWLRSHGATAHEVTTLPTGRDTA